MMTKISEVFELQMGKTPSRKNLDYWIDGNTDWVSISDLGTYEKYVGKTKEKITQQAIDESGIKAVPKNTVLMSFKLSIGISAITREEKTYTNEAIMAFIDKGEKSLFPDYFYHQFRTKDWLENTSKAVMGSTLNKSKLSNCIIKVPDLDEQKHVASVLDAVCRLILIKEDLCKKLDELVKSRFVEMFGNADSSSANFNISTINEICSSIVRGPFGSALKKEFFIPRGVGTYKVYEQKHAIRKRADIGTYYISKEKFDSLKRFECKPGDILMSCSGTMGELYQLPMNCEPGIINQALCKFTLNEKIHPEYFFRFMSQVVDDLGAKGSGIKNVSSVKYIKDIKIPLPPLSLQQEFAAFVHQVDKLKFETQQSIEKLQTLYDSLAQEYFAPEGD